MMERSRWTRLQSDWAILSINILLVLLFLSTSGIYAQEELKVEEVQVIKDFEARLKDFKKVNLEPVLPEFDISSRNYQYIISSKPLSVEHEKPSIRPLALVQTPAEEQKSGLFALAYGVPNALYGEFNFGKINNSFASALAVRHRSANNKKIENQKYLTNDIDFHLSNTFVNDVQLETHAFLNADYFNLYGIEANKDTFPNFSTPQRRTFHWNIGASVYKEEWTDNMDGGVDFWHNFLYNNIEEVTEHTTGLKAKLDFSFKNDLSLRIPLSFNLLANSILDSKGLFEAEPVFRLNRNYFTMDIGADLAYADTLMVFPEIKLSLKKLFGYFDIFLGSGQEGYLNSIYRKNIENPFLRITSDSVNFSTEQGFYAGIIGDFEGAKVEVTASYLNYRNMHLYIPSIVDTRQFDVIYDDGRDFELSAKVSYEISKNLKVRGKLSKHFYSLENEAYAWHRPGFEADFSTGLSFFEKRLSVDGKLFFASGLKYPDPNSGVAVTLPALFDISARVDFKALKNLNLFIEWNNLTASKYYRWYQYPSYRLHLIGGLKFNF